jgi:hypothetical protein
MSEKESNLYLFFLKLREDDEWGWGFEDRRELRDTFVEEFILLNYERLRSLWRRTDELRASTFADRPPEDAEDIKVIYTEVWWDDREDHAAVQPVIARPQMVSGQLRALGTKMAVPKNVPYFMPYSVDEP